MDCHCFAALCTFATLIIAHGAATQRQPITAALKEMNDKNSNIINEKDIMVKPSHYLELLNKYDQVIFELLPESYESLKTSWNKYRDLRNSGIKINSDTALQLIDTTMNDAVVGVFTFMLVAAKKQDNIVIDKSDQSIVRLTIAK